MKINKEELAEKIRFAYYISFKGFPPSEYRLLEEWEKRPWQRMLDDLMKGMNLNEN